MFFFGYKWVFLEKKVFLENVVDVVFLECSIFWKVVSIVFILKKDMFLFNIEVKSVLLTMDKIGSGNCIIFFIILKRKNILWYYF